MRIIAAMWKEIGYDDTKVHSICIFAENNKDFHLEVINNPEFLAEGTAINDLLHPHRMLIGGENTASGQAAVQALSDIYAMWVPKDRIITMNT